METSSDISPGRRAPGSQDLSLLLAASLMASAPLYAQASPDAPRDDTPRDDAPAPDAPATLLGLEHDPCVQVERELLTSMLSRELGVEVIQAARAPLASPIVELRCDEAGQILVRVENPSTDRSLERPLTLQATARPLERARLLTLAITEALDSSGQTFAAPEPAPEPPDPVAPEPPPAPRRWHLAGLGLGQIGAADQLPTLGMSAALTHDTWAHTGWGIELSAGAGERDAALGQIAQRRLSAALGWGPRLGREHLSVHLLVGARAGAILWRGTPAVPARAEGQQVWTPWAGPATRGLVTLRPVPWLGWSVGAELGWTALGSQATIDGQPSLAMRGPWLGLSTGLTWSF